MGTDKKNWRDTLDGLKQNDLLEVTDIEVRRLHDESSEIIAGQEVAFVANFKLRLAQQSSSLAPNVGKGDVLLEMSSAGELQSEYWDQANTDQREALSQWLAANYGFQWSVDGRPGRSVEPRHARDSRGGTPALGVPWLLELDTMSFAGRYVDVRVNVRPMPAPSEAARQPAKAPGAPLPKPPAPPPARSPAEDWRVERLVIIELQGERQRPVPLDDLPAVVEACLRDLEADMRDGDHYELILSLAWHPSRSATKG